MNVSADYVNNKSDQDEELGNHFYDEDDNPLYRNNTTEGIEEDDFNQYNDEIDGSNAAERVKNIQRQINLQQNMNIRSESGFGQLDVSLPMIKQQ